MAETTVARDGKAIEQAPQAGLAIRRKAIIDSILTNGLKSAKRLQDLSIPHLPSADKVPFDEIEGCVLRPTPDYPNDESRREALDEAFYIMDRSIFPVFIEREIDMAGVDNFYSSKKYGRYTRMTASEKAAAEERMRASMVVVCKFDLDHREDLQPTEFMNEDTLTPEEIAYVVIPKGIYAEYVGNGGTKLNGVPTVVVDKTVKKRVLKLQSNTFQVPGYEQALTEVANKLSCPIWAHAVRLPTNEDLYWEEEWKKAAEERNAWRKTDSEDLAANE